MKKSFITVLIFVVTALTSRSNIGVTFWYPNWFWHLVQQCEVCAFSSVSQIPNLLGHHENMPI